MYGRISFAPRAQLRPTASGATWRIEVQNASVTWPDSVRPLASVMVPETITGHLRPRSSNTVSTAKIAALAFRVSKIVSMKSRSDPPSSRPLVASAYAATSWSKDTLRAPGSLTSGEMDAVRVVGPSAPATYRFLSGVRAVTSSATRRASRAASRFSS